VVATLEVMRVSMMRFSQKLVAELFQPFWAAWQAGEFMTDAAAVAGTYRQRGLAWVRESGGVRPRRGRDLAGRYLSFAEREEIALGRACGESVRCLARRLHRFPSTVSRELSRNSDRDGVYRSAAAHTRAYARAGRPKPAKLAVHPRLRAVVQTIGTLVERSTGFTMLVHLPGGYRPEQMAHALSTKILTLPEVLRGSLTRAWRCGTGRPSRWAPTSPSTSATRTAPGNVAPTKIL